MLQLLTLLWFFNPSQPALSTLTAEKPQATFAAPANADHGFTIRFTVDLNKVRGERSVLEIPGVLDVRLLEQGSSDRNRQNYPAFRMPDGSLPVLEATLTLHSTEHPDWKTMTIGIPLAMLKEPKAPHEVVLQFTGVRWTLYVDGRLLDNDFPFGYPRMGEKPSWRLDPEHVKTASLYVPAIELQVKKAETPEVASTVQYWTPPGHNSWVGDVVTCFHGGRYHVFYLYDRRHHQSKFGCGAHYFEHLSTRDFRTWTEHEAATPLEEQWECIGTGTPFAFDGKLHLSYGLHTTRVYPKERTTLPLQWEYLKSHGRTRGFARDAAPGFPAGSTYAVSTDGVSHFRKSHVLFHPCENPSVYVDPDGRLRMMANYGSNGIWASDAIDGGWHCVNPGFPPGGDCTFFFRWGKFDYIIGGFKNLWSKPAEAPISAYVDVVARGQDFYDGLGVPAITEVPGGRFLMAGWLAVRGWGGTLVFRELIQSPDGRIGSKWLEEVTPKAGPPRRLAETLSETAAFPSGDRPFLLTFDVQPAQAGGRLGVSFLPGQGEQAGCELQVRPADRRAQFGAAQANAFAPREKSLREGGGPQAIENLIAVDRPFSVRVIVKGDDKLGGSLVDAEIAGSRTMISYRPDLSVRRLAFRVEGLELKNIQIAPLEP